MACISDTKIKKVLERIASGKLTKQENQELNERRATCESGMYIFYTYGRGFGGFSRHGAELMIQETWKSVLIEVVS